MNKLIIPVCALTLSTCAPIDIIANSHTIGQTKEVSNAKSESAITAADVEKRVKEVIVRCLDIKEKDLKLTTRLKEDLGADSLDAVEIIMEIEKEFNITIPDEDAENILTVKDAIKYVKGMVRLKDR